MANEIGPNPEINPHEQGINPEIPAQHEIAPTQPQENLETTPQVTPTEAFHPVPVEMPDEATPPVLGDQEISLEEMEEKANHDVYSPAGELDPSDAMENLMKMVNRENPDTPHQ